jgi:hypothetical protein
MVKRWKTLVKLHRKVKYGSATEPEKRRYRIFLREEARAKKAQKIAQKIYGKRRKRIKK